MTQETKTQIAEAEQVLLHTYNRFPLILDRGEGMYLYDSEGRRYLDFFAGIAVFALGHHYPGFDEALKAQIDRLIHTSNYYYNEPAVRAAKKLAEASGLDRVFFTNSGTEAVEGALKTARKYYYQKTGRQDAEIIAFHHAFHGRTFGALSVTGTEAYRTPFAPLIGGVHFADYNDIESVQKLINEKTCAIILETVQGEGGIHEADTSFLQTLRTLCDEKDILLILDEIQCGMGRCGTMFAFEEAGILPDVLTVAKALGGGVPVGAFVMNEKTANQSLVPGDHGTTYGGNPLACTAADTMLTLLAEKKIIDHVKEAGAYLTKSLDSLSEKHPEIVARRGRGLMQGLQFDRPVADILTGARDKGLLLINAGANVIRFVPPLITEESHIDEMIEILEGSL